MNDGLTIIVFYRFPNFIFKHYVKSVINGKVETTILKSRAKVYNTHSELNDLHNDKYFCRKYAKANGFKMMLREP